MDPSRAEPSTFDTGACWLTVSPPLQPKPVFTPFGAASNGMQVQRDFELRDECGFRRVARQSGGSLQRTGSDVDQVDCLLCRERWETIYTAANLGLGECPSWLILAIERTSAQIDDSERAYLESLIWADYEHCHPDETLEDIKRGPDFQSTTTDCSGTGWLSRPSAQRPRSRFRPGFSLRRNKMRRLV